MEIGQFNQAEVIKETDFGLFLDIEGEEAEILLPTKYIPNGTEVGDTIEVFVYKDSEDRNIATTLNPKAKVGDFAYLEVKDVNRIGAFLDWGLAKDLLVPFSEQRKKMREGREYIVRVYLDQSTNRIAATEKFDSFIETDMIDLKEEEEVDLLVYRWTDLGVEVIINNKYYGLIYDNDLYKNVKTGDRTTGYIKKIRDDNKIDVSLRRIGYGKVEDAKAKILKELKNRDGFLALTDKSSPKRIKNMLEISKNSFKKAIGGLYKERIVDLTDEGVKLK